MNHYEKIIETLEKVLGECPHCGVDSMYMYMSMGVLYCSECKSVRAYPSGISFEGMEPTYLEEDPVVISISMKILKSKVPEVDLPIPKDHKIPSNLKLMEAIEKDNKENPIEETEDE